MLIKLIIVYFWNKNNIKKLQSILLLKSPRCRKGNLLEAHPYKLSKFNKVNQSCNHCALQFKIEPSFFYGSMYVSYGLGEALSIAVYLLLLISGISSSLKFYFLIISGVLILLMPYINALSKVICAGFFFKFDSNYATNNTKEWWWKSNLNTELPFPL